MSRRRDEVVEHALVVLDRHGLADLSMRRLATDLGIRPSALYWHFANKQSLLAAVADEVLRRGDRPATDGTWRERVTEHAHVLRDAMLAYRDGAELVATAHAFGLGEIDVVERFAALLPDDAVAAVAAPTLVYFVLGYVQDEQLHLHASSAGAIDADPLARNHTFGLGLGIIVDGIGARVDAP